VLLRKKGDFGFRESDCRKKLEREGGREGEGSSLVLRESGSF
jgi:hypothetical protein